MPTKCSNAAFLLLLISAAELHAAEPALNRSTFLWPEGVVPFTFASGFNEDNGQLVIECLLEIEAATCLRFRQREFEQAYLEFVATDTNICRTEVVGHPLSGRNRIQLGPGCFTKRALFHEILHSLGLYHEHQRPDRDRYVTINYDNIADDHRREFAVQASTDPRIVAQTDYDYQSILHYDAHAFARSPGLLTIEANDKSFTRLLGKAEAPSAGDYRKIAMLYSCPQSTKVQLTDVTTFETYRAGSNVVPLWPLGVVPFTFSANVTLKQRKAIRQAIAHIDSETCLAFEEGQFDGEQFGYVEFQLIDTKSRHRSGVDSSGAVYGKKAFRLKADSYTNERLINFWLLATVGLVPEVRRPDRDSHVNINWDNVDQNNWSLLAKYDRLDARLLNIPYDIESVMHYRSDAFAKNGELETISPVDKSLSSRVIGKATRPTKLDFRKINAIYNNCRASKQPTEKSEETSNEDEIEIEEEVDVSSGRDKFVLPNTNQGSSSEAGQAVSGATVELVVFLSILAALIVFMVVLIAVVRYKRHKSLQNRGSGEIRSVRAAAIPLRRQTVADDDDFDDDVEASEASALNAAGRQSQAKQRHSNVQYRPVSQDDYQQEQEQIMETLDEQEA